MRSRREGGEFSLTEMLHERTIEGQSGEMREMGTQCEDGLELSVGQAYFPVASRFGYEKRREPTVRIRSVRRERRKEESRQGTAIERRRTGSFVQMIKPVEKGPSQSQFLSNSPDRVCPSTPTPAEDPLGSEMWSELLPLRIGLDAGTRHFRLGSWKKDFRDFTSPSRGSKSPLSAYLRYPDYSTLTTYSRKKKVYYKTKPTQEARVYGQDIRKRKAFLKLDGKRQALLPCTPSPTRLRRSPSP